MGRILQNKVIRTNLNKLKKNELTVSERFFLVLIKYCPIELRTVSKHWLNLFYKIKFKGYR